MPLWVALWMWVWVCRVWVVSLRAMCMVGRHRQNEAARRTLVGEGEGEGHGRCAEWIWCGHNEQGGEQ